MEKFLNFIPHIAFAYYFFYYTNTIHIFYQPFITRNFMKQTILRITNTAFALLITTSVMTASNKTMPKFVQEYMWQIEHVEKQLTSLESAIPQEKYMWRPAEDVRSFSEVYLHAAFGNYLFIKTLGAKLNNDFNFVFTEAKKWDSQTTDKKEVETIVKKSFENLTN